MRRDRFVLAVLFLFGVGMIIIVSVHQNNSRLQSKFHRSMEHDGIVVYRNPKTIEETPNEIIKENFIFLKHNKTQPRVPWPTTEKKNIAEKLEDLLYRKLVNLEKQFGGIMENVARGKTSKYDPRPQSVLGKHGLTGGDRMSPEHHNYGKFYAKYLSKLTNVTNIAEVGILKGTGIAIFSELFPSSTVYGFDIDLSYIKDNMNFLRQHGAFRNKNIQLHTFDQYEPNLNISTDTKFSIVIDDGVHFEDAVTLTFETFRPYLQQDFVYVVEDCVCKKFRSHLEQKYRNFIIDYKAIASGSEISFITQNTV